MAEHNNGDPAFACASEHGYQSGMTLRDWFAGQALMGIMADPGILPGVMPSVSPLARTAYALADAMIAEREK